MKKYILIYITIYSLFPAFGQEYHQSDNWLFNANKKGWHIYEAKNRVKLSTGFSFLANNNESFTGKVNEKILYPDMAYAYKEMNGIITSDPDGVYAVGAIPGQFNVSPTGAATYTVPFEVTPGVKGVQPSMALSYSSQSGNGVIGLGWNISGLSMITRVPQNLYYDGAIKGVSLTSSDKLSYDGARLIEYANNAPSSIEYKTEIDNGNKIIAYNIGTLGPETFTVYLKDGRKMYYSQLPIDQVRLNTSTGEIQDIVSSLGWSIKKIEDKYGNYVEYDYSFNSTLDNGNLYNINSYKLSEITYGSSVSEIGRVEFLYESRSEKLNSFICSKKISLNERVKEVKVYSSYNGTNTLLKTYSLKYATGKDKLIAIGYEGMEGKKLMDLKFSWGENNSTVFIGDEVSIEDKDQDALAKNKYWLSDDYNNDGLMDLASVYLDKTTSPDSYSVQIYTSDGSNNFSKWEHYSYPSRTEIYYDGTIGSNNLFDGTLEQKMFEVCENQNFSSNFSSKNYRNFGRIEFSMHGGVDPVTGNTTSKLNLYDYDYVTANGGESLVAESTLKNINPCGSPAFAVVDFEQNGYDDIIYVENEWVGVRSPGEYKNNFPGKILSGGGGSGIEFTLKLLSKPDYIIPSDFNSDGLIDILVVTAVEYAIFTNTGDYNNPWVLYSEGNDICAMGQKIKMGDFNGDGMLDLFTYPNQGVLANCHFHLNQGDGSFEDNQIIMKANSDEVHDQVIITDFNCDGKSDVIWLDEGTDITYYISDGENVTKYTDGIGVTSSSLPLGTLVMGDFNGDGRESMISLVKNPIGNRDGPQIIYPFNTRSAWNKIYQFERPSSTNVDVTYSTLADNSVYTCDLTSFTQNYIKPLILPMSVVKSVALEQNLMVQDYAYEQGVLHTLGKGFLGFTKTTVTDSHSEISSLSTSYLNNDKYILIPEKTQQIKNDGVLSEAKQSYEIIHPYSPDESIYRLQLTQSVQTNFQSKTGSKTDYLVYDTYGNPKSIRTTYFDDGELIEGRSKQISISYTGKGSWCDYLPLMATETITKDEHLANSDTESKVTHYDYYENGDLKRVVTDSTSFFQVSKSISAYNVYGNPENIVVTTPNDGVSNNNNTSTFEYSDDGRFVVKEDNNGLISRKEYNLSKAQLFSSTDPAGLVTHYFHNALGQRYKTSSPSGVETYTTLHHAGANFHDELFGITPSYYTISKTAGAAATRTYYNIHGDMVRIVDSLHYNDKVYTDRNYDKQRRLISETMPYFAGDLPSLTQYSYDEYNRLEKITSPDGTVTHKGYNDLLRIDTLMIKKNGETQISLKYYDELGQLESSVDNNGNTVKYSYDVAGRLVASWIDGYEEDKTIITYDDKGNRLLIYDPDAGLISSTYDAYNRVQTHTNARNHTTSYIYDDLSRVVEATTTGDNMLSETLTYDYIQSGSALGQLNWVKFNDEKKEDYSYDEFGRMIAMTEYVDEQPFVHSHTYDDYGRIATKSYPGGFTIANRYDRMGDIEIVTYNNQHLIHVNKYSANGLLSFYSIGGSEVSSQYDDVGRITSRSCSGKHRMKYSYDDMGNLKARFNRIDDQIEEFHYDNINRLIRTDYGINGENGGVSFQENVVYDPRGNILSKTGVGAGIKYGDIGVSADNAVAIEAGPHALSAITIPMGYQPNNQDVTYTYFNKAKLITQGAYTYDYSYGIDKQREKTVFKNGTTTLRTKYYLGDYEKVIEADGTVKEYHYLSSNSGLYGIFVKTNGIGKMYCTLTDHLGSLTEVIDASDNQIVEKYSYNAWGVPREGDDWNTKYTGELFADRGFTGHEHLPAVFGLIDMNGRMYDPALGRFLSPDPYVQSPDYAQNFNRYAYCYNNPLVYTDPSGEFVGLAFAAVAAVSMGMHAGHMAFANGGDFWKDGFWKGATVGFAIGAIGASGFAPLGTDWLGTTIWGAALGTASHAGSVWAQGGNNYEDIWQGALIGGAMGFMASEEFGNMSNGKGFKNDNEVYTHMLKDGSSKQDILDYFDAGGKYDPKNKLFGRGADPGFTDPISGDIYYSDNIFKLHVDDLKLVIAHERRHSSDVLSGRYNNKKIDFNLEEYNTWKYSYKNEGLYPNNTYNEPLRMNMYMPSGVSIKELNRFGYYFDSLRPKSHFVYKIPRLW